MRTEYKADTDLLQRGEHLSAAVENGQFLTGGLVTNRLRTNHCGGVSDTLAGQAGKHHRTEAIHRFRLFTQGQVLMA